jgi:hypothetical protein
VFEEKCSILFLEKDRFVKQNNKNIVLIYLENIGISNISKKLMFALFRKL